ncbi:hypothetical protein JW998_07595 [candidate division KSB1 bacterium]|nr:hypothetical protein [candidate division KSB1 bacterium]
MTQENAKPLAEQSEQAAKPLDPNAILIAEFEYARETAAQAMEDRHKMVQFYVISIFIPYLTAMVGLMALGAKKSELLQFSLFRHVVLAAFVILFLMGVLFLLTLIRLRVAWFESAMSMNKIKSFYSSHMKNYKLDREAYNWTIDSLKHLKFGKTNSIFFYSALLVILIDSCAFFAALVCSKLDSMIALAGALLFFILQIIFYKAQKF